jgi:Ala-tRNA(Pro) deacylase
MTEQSNHSAYRRLIDLLDLNGASYRLIDHEPEGRTEIVSPMRGNDLAAAAKCMIVMVKITKKQKVHVLAVVPGDRRVDLAALKALEHGTYAGFAAPEIAEDLSGCEVGTVLPFAFDDRLELVVDAHMYDHDVIFFNAGRLDRSVALAAADYRRIAAGRTATISLP